MKHTEFLQERLFHVLNIGFKNKMLKPVKGRVDEFFNRNLTIDTWQVYVAFIINHEIMEELRCNDSYVSLSHYINDEVIPNWIYIDGKKLKNRVYNTSLKNKIFYFLNSWYNLEIRYDEWLNKNYFSNKHVNETDTYLIEFLKQKGHTPETFGYLPEDIKTALRFSFAKKN